MERLKYVELANVGERGQVTIPKDIRELLTIKPKDRVVFEVRGRLVLIMKVPKSPAKAFVKLFEKDFKDIDSVEFQRRIRTESERKLLREMKDLYEAGG